LTSVYFNPNTRYAQKREDYQRISTAPIRIIVEREDPTPAINIEKIMLAFFKTIVLFACGGKFRF
jgi:hypothetical protein